MLLTIVSYRTPALLTEIKVMLLTTLIVMWLAGVVVVAVALLVAIPSSVWLGLAVTAAYAVATYPRSKAVQLCHE